MLLTPLERLLDSEIPAWAWRGVLRAPYYTPKHDERRRHRRVSTDDPALMRMVEPYSPVRWMIRVVDVSKSGMKLLVPSSIKPGSLVQVHMNDTSVLAKVRHCAMADPKVGPDGLFHAGVEIQHVF